VAYGVTSGGEHEVEDDGRKRGAMGESVKPQAIEWSLAGGIEADDEGRLTTAIPATVAEALGVSGGDVLCWTGFADGTVEVWSVAKSPYSSLDDAAGEQQ